MAEPAAVFGSCRRFGQVDMESLFAVSSCTLFDRRLPVSLEDLPVQALCLGHRLHAKLAGENAPT